MWATGFEVVLLLLRFFLTKGAQRAEMEKRFFDFLQKMPATRPAEIQTDYEKQLAELKKKYGN